MSYFYADISYSSKEDDSKIEKIISPLLQKYVGSRDSSVIKLTKNNHRDEEGNLIFDSEKNTIAHKIRYKFSKEHQRNDFIQAVNLLNDGIFAQTFL
jgi:hypothetical protein